MKFIALLASLAALLVVAFAAPEEYVEEAAPREMHERYDVRVTNLHNVCYATFSNALPFFFQYGYSNYGGGYGKGKGYEYGKGKGHFDSYDKKTPVYSSYSSYSYGGYGGHKKHHKH